MKKRTGPWGRLSVGVLAALTLGALGCLPELNDPDRGPLTQTFAVSDYFAPSGFMGDGQYEGFMTMDVNQNCKKRPAGAQGDCYHFRYYMDPTSGFYWGGVYWVFPSNSWGSRPGYAFSPNNFKQVRFYAAVETPSINTTKGGGTSFFNGIAGNINGGDFYGTACTLDQQRAGASNCEHDDGVKAENNYAIGTDINADLKPYHIIPSDVITGQDPAELIGGFAWSMDFPSDSCTCSDPSLTILECMPPMGMLNCPTPVDVYLDDIVWDTNAPAAAPTP
jgi:hypothetical protein